MQLSEYKKTLTLGFEGAVTANDSDERFEPLAALLAQFKELPDDYPRLQLLLGLEYSLEHPDDDSENEWHGECAEAIFAELQRLPVPDDLDDLLDRLVEAIEILKPAFEDQD